MRRQPPLLHHPSILVGFIALHHHAIVAHSRDRRAPQPAHLGAAVAALGDQAAVPLLDDGGDGYQSHRRSKLLRCQANASGAENGEVEVHAPRILYI